MCAKENLLVDGHWGKCKIFIVILIKFADNLWRWLLNGFWWITCKNHTSKARWGRCHGGINIGYSYFFVSAVGFVFKSPGKKRKWTIARRFDSNTEASFHACLFFFFLEMPNYYLCHSEKTGPLWDLNLFKEQRLLFLYPINTDHLIKSDIFGWSKWFVIVFFGVYLISFDAFCEVTVGVFKKKWGWKQEAFPFSLASGGRGDWQGDPAWPSQKARCGSKERACGWVIR